MGRSGISKTYKQITEYGACFGSTHTEVGTIQREFNLQRVMEMRHAQRLAWPLCKDDTQIGEVFHIFMRVLVSPPPPALPLINPYFCQKIITEYED